MEDLNQFIDGLLDEHRPERYDATDRKWRTPVYEAIEALVPEVEARRIAASQKVDARETSATKGVNRLLRDIGRSGQWPIDLMDQERRPLSIDTERVRLVDATGDDLNAWAIQQRRVAAQDFGARSAACDGAEWCASEMTANGWRTFGEAAR